MLLFAFMYLLVYRLITERCYFLSIFSEISVQSILRHTAALCVCVCVCVVCVFECTSAKHFYLHGADDAVCGGVYCCILLNTDTVLGKENCSDLPLRGARNTQRWTE